MHTIQMNRLFSYDSIVGFLVVAVLLHIVLISAKRWKEIGIFHLAGAMNFIVEIFMFHRGIRIVHAPWLLRWTAIWETSWLDLGLFALLTYANTRFFFKRRDSSGWWLVAVNLLFFLAMPMAALNYGGLHGSVLAQRVFSKFRLLQTAQVLATTLPVLLLYFLKFRKLSLLVLGQGIIYGMAFQFRLMVSGIREASIAPTSAIIIDGATLASSVLVMTTFLAVMVNIIKMDDFSNPGPVRNPLARTVRMRIAAFTAIRRSNISLLVWIPALFTLLPAAVFGRPWNKLPGAAERKDRESRRMIGDAVIIYRSMLKHIPKKKALKAVETLVYVSALRYLKDLIPVMDEDFFAQSEDNLRTSVLSLVDSFPNTVHSIEESRPPRLRYIVHRCRFVELVRALGHPELGPAFCAADGAYFREVQRLISMRRPATIGRGDNYCDFDFTVRLPRQPS